MGVASGLAGLQSLRQKIHQDPHPVRDVTVAGQNGKNPHGWRLEFGQDGHHIAPLQKGFSYEIRLPGNS